MQEFIYKVYDDLPLFLNTILGAPVKPGPMGCREEEVQHMVMQSLYTRVVQTTEISVRRTAQGHPYAELFLER